MLHMHALGLSRNIKNCCMMPACLPLQPAVKARAACMVASIHTACTLAHTPVQHILTHRSTILPARDAQHHDPHGDHNRMHQGRVPCTNGTASLTKQQQDAARYAVVACMSMLTGTQLLAGAKHCFKQLGEVQSAWCWGWYRVQGCQVRPAAAVRVTSLHQLASSLAKTV